MEMPSSTKSTLQGSLKVGADHNRVLMYFAEPASSRGRKLLVDGSAVYLMFVRTTNPDQVVAPGGAHRAGPPMETLCGLSAATTTWRRLRRPLVMRRLSIDFFPPGKGFGRRREL